MAKLRVAIYARHSTIYNNPQSSNDQADACAPLIERLGGIRVATYSDPEISGYRRDRPGLLEMLVEMHEGRVDVVVCEAMDRIARDGEDINWLEKKFHFDRVRLVTIAEGEIDAMKFAIASMLGSMFLNNLRLKTRRGMQAAVLSGRFAGGRAYGYRKVSKIDERGRPINGLMQIDPAEALIVRRIYEEFAKGKSSLEIAKGLNSDGIPSPRGGEWNASTIRGDPKRHSGILNNSLYRGVLIWNRREWRKDPNSDLRRRRPRLRDKDEWVTVDATALAIVTVELAAEVRHEMAVRSLSGKGKPANAKRKKHLLSGLIKCGECGGNFTIAGKDYYRCSHNRERGTCSNSRMVRVRRAEAAVLDALKERLLTNDLAQVFVKEFQQEFQRLSADQGRNRKRLEDRLNMAQREISNLAQNLLSGVVSATLAKLLGDREDEVENLQRQLAADEAPLPIILPHPKLLDVYRDKIGALQAALTSDHERTEAIGIIQRLVDRIVVNADGDDVVLDIEASGAKLVDFALAKKNPRRSGDRSVTVVAGVGFEPTTFRL